MPIRPRRGPHVPDAAAALAEIADGQARELVAPGSSRIRRSCSRARRSCSLRAAAAPRSSCRRATRWSRSRSSSARPGRRGPGPSRGYGRRRARRAPAMKGKRSATIAGELVLEARDLRLQRRAAAARSPEPDGGRDRVAAARAGNSGPSSGTPCRTRFYQRPRRADRGRRPLSASSRRSTAPPRRTASARPRDLDREQRQQRGRARGAVRRDRLAEQQRQRGPGVRHDKPSLEQRQRLGRPPERLALAARADARAGPPASPRPAPTPARRCRPGRSAARPRAARRWGSRRAASARAPPPRSACAPRRGRGRCGGRTRGRRPAPARAGC